VVTQTSCTRAINRHRQPVLAISNHCPKLSCAILLQFFAPSLLSIRGLQRTIQALHDRKRLRTVTDTSVLDTGCRIPNFVRTTEFELAQTAVSRTNFGYFLASAAALRRATYARISQSPRSSSRTGGVIVACLHSSGFNTCRICSNRPNWRVSAADFEIAC
jgi:hypothetical protein